MLYLLYVFQALGVKQNQGMFWLLGMRHAPHPDALGVRLHSGAQGEAYRVGMRWRNKQHTIPEIALEGTFLPFTEDQPVPSVGFDFKPGNMECRTSNAYQPFISTLDISGLFVLLNKYSNKYCVIHYNIS